MKALESAPRVLISYVELTLMQVRTAEGVAVCAGEELLG